ncbi:hypothetical protein [Variovorax sp. N23]|nr:hypothetical protein [Variovorax sp. N23]MCU4118675.1 hypothetical protein [Variovorax sp. N23]
MIPFSALAMASRDPGAARAPAAQLETMYGSTSGTTIASPSLAWA